MKVNRYGPIVWPECPPCACRLFPSALVSQSTQLTRMEYDPAWHTGL
jgi:hypothetical protein